MAEYFDRDALLEKLANSSETWAKNIENIRNWWPHAVRIKDNIVAEIKRQPPADVEEVKHGRWMKDPHTADVCAEYRCSLCGYSYCEADPKHPPFKYCPECGAKNE